jgi:hypothetical protein
MSRPNGLATALNQLAVTPVFWLLPGWYYVPSISLQIKSMDSRVRLGGNRSHSRSYGEDLQRRMAGEGAISCKWFGGT